MTDNLNGKIDNIKQLTEEWNFKTIKTIPTCTCVECGSSYNHNYIRREAAKVGSMTMLEICVCGKMKVNGVLGRWYK